LPGALRRGSRLGKYKLERSIGKGAFSEVFAARDTVEGRRVALKVAFDWVVREFGREAMEVEARIASSLSHPNVVATRNADWIEGRFVIASELARSHVYDYPSAWRSGAVALRIVRDVAAGLAHAHQRRLMHRDLKPENVLVFADGHAAITDFGVSRFVRPAESRSYTDAGTMGYMAPEQAYGRPTLASDVFSLGVIGYELLTGKLLKWPFSWPPEQYERFRAKVPEPLRPVLQRACAFDPARRFPSGVELHAALEHAFARLETSQTPTTRRRRRRPSEPPDPFRVGMELFRRRHGRALRMSYSCRRCQGPIAEAMTACPWCGSKDNSFKEITSAPLICGRCERGVLPEWTACPWCYAGRFQGNGKPPRADPQALRRCKTRGCPGRLRLFMRYCPVCKAKPGRPWRYEGLPERCVRCDWPTSRTFFRYCAWCGRHQRPNS
jgi:eukaryotic-like serine/threonine-protein kinase